MHVHNTSNWERAEIGQRLFTLFTIRLQIYNRKFFVKFLNNFLAQLTPFFFYAIGGYFALRGTLDIGQLVAVVAAYRELPPPVEGADRLGSAASRRSGEIRSGHPAFRRGAARPSHARSRPGNGAGRTARRTPSGRGYPRRRSSWRT